MDAVQIMHLDRESKTLLVYNLVQDMNRLNFIHFLAELVVEWKDWNIDVLNRFNREVQEIIWRQQQENMEEEEEEDDSDTESGYNTDRNHQ